MKKLKLNLDKEAIKGFFLQHVEKLLFAAVMVFFLVFVYSALGREGYTKVPDDLKQVAKDADSKVESTPPKLPEGVKPPRDFATEIAATAGRIDPTYYQHAILWRPPVFDPPPKRGEPRLIAVRDLRGTPGNAAVRVSQSTGATGATGPYGSGKEVVGERWVVLTGLVPKVEQIKAYYDAFKHAAGERTGGGGMPGAMEMGGASRRGKIDLPQYVHYHVQRVEVDSGGEEINEDAWEASAIHVGRAKRQASQQWGGAMHGATPGDGSTLGGVSPRYIEPALDFPMPVFARQREFDEAFAHLPEVPLAPREKPRYGPDGTPLEPETVVEGEGPAGDVPARDDVPDRPSDLPMMGRPGMMEGPMGPGVVPGAAGYGEAGVETMLYEEHAGGPGMGMGQKVRMPDHKLFRFIDRDVEPGRKYRYRVRLMLFNPNYGVEPRYLERVDLGAEEYIVTDWSDPSPIVEVPRDDRLLVLGVKPSLRVAGDPKASVALVKWMNEEGIEASKEEMAERGRLANLADCTWPEVEKRPTTKTSSSNIPGAAGELEELFEAVPPPTFTPGAGGMTGEQPIPLDYQTEALVIDMRGGFRIDVDGQGRSTPSRETHENAPGEVLVLDADGDLVVRNELIDTPAYEALKRRRDPPRDEMMPGYGPGMEAAPGMELLMPGYVPEEVPGAKSNKKGRRRSPLRE